eukprot:m.56137 g.56137  ORF g.56137 m.56137 type:complete len:192 (+) comp11176_c0_seq1:159-734(+)
MSSGKEHTEEEFIPTVATKQKEMLLVSSMSAEDNQMLVSPQSVHRMHDPEDLVQLASFVQSADNATKASVGGKLELISEQIKALQRQAREVLEEAKRDVELNHAKCNFKRIPNKMYHLYRQPSGDTYFSMLSPSEWGSSLKDEFVGSYRLEFDMTWTPEDKIQEREQRRQFDASLLGVSKQQSAALALEMK